MSPALRASSYSSIPKRFAGSMRYLRPRIFNFFGLSEKRATSRELLVACANAGRIAVCANHPRPTTAYRIFPPGPFLAATRLAASAFRDFRAACAPRALPFPLPFAFRVVVAFFALAIQSSRPRRAGMSGRGKFLATRGRQRPRILLQMPDANSGNPERPPAGADGHAPDITFRRRPRLGERA